MRLIPFVAGLLALMAGPTLASTVGFDFGGAGVSGSVVLKYGPATDARYSDGYQVTGISGTFSNDTLGIVDARIRGLVAVTHSVPHPDNLLAPDNFSRFAVASGLPALNGGFLSYDNLYWPGGSPQTASDYPPHGGVLDIYGLMFRIGNGRVVNLWSNGVFGPDADYGAAVATVDRALDYVSGGLSVSPAPVPVPAAFWMLASGIAGLFVWKRRRVVA
jgi:hypothetical protein